MGDPTRGSVVAKPHEIIQALTDRLDAAGLPVYQGLVLDPSVDADQELPAVVIHQNKDGDRAIKTRPRLVREMRIIVEAWIVTTSEKTALTEILEYGEAVREVAAPFDSYDTPDTLDGLANSVVFEGITAHTQERNWAIAQIAITIQYGG